MKHFLTRLLTPWRAGPLFTENEAFYGFLARRNRLLGVLRAILLAAAAGLLICSYALSDQPRNVYMTGALCALLLTLGVSLLIIQNEKALPEERRAK